MGTAEKKSVAFICVGNACRSQMSEGLARHLAGDHWKVYSAGSRPAGFVAPEAVAAMAKRGIDISRQHSKGVEDLPLQEFDWVITMGCGDFCPTLRGKKILDWPIPDPIGQGPEVFEKVAENLEARIRQLLLEEDALPTS
jgi:arsenate reductase